MKFAHFRTSGANPGHDAASALRAVVARAAVMRRTRLRLRLLRRASLPARRELDVFAEPLCGWRRRTQASMRVGPMGYVVPLYHPLRLAEEIAIVDQMLGGRMELGLVPGINADYFRPFGIDYDLRKSPTLEFVDYLRAAFGKTQPFSFHGDEFHTENAKLAVQPFQKPHPPLWMMSRDPQTLEFCAQNGINPGYFLVYPRADAAPRYRKFLEDWAQGRLAAETEYRLLHDRLCGRDRREGAGGRAFPRQPRL